MKRAGRPRTHLVNAVCGGFLAGVLVTLVIATDLPPKKASQAGAAEDRATSIATADTPEPAVKVRPAPSETPAAVTAPPTPAPTGPEVAADPIEDLRDRHLTLPVRGIERDDIRDAFNEARDGRRHEAIDVLAPRNTPVLAVEDGTIAKLFLSKAGGITVYQFDPTATYTYYYAHLERYAEGLTEKDRVKRGQVLGYVGTSGNAPANTPHLHFAIFKLTEEKHWWHGTALDPYRVLR
jgi:murein DD-endopeptidase MepM/ murein hydrolase activator NlpD